MLTTTSPTITPSDIATLINTAGLVAFAALSIWLAVIDLREHRLPNRLVAAVAMCALVSQGIQTLLAADPTPNWVPLIRSVVVGIACFCLYLLLHVASRTKDGAGMGAGDVKLAGALGLYLGWISIETALFGIAAGFVLGALFSLVVIGLRRGNRRSRVAFGPWMLAGGWLAILASSIRFA